MKQLPGLLGWLAASFAAAAPGGFASASAGALLLPYLAWVTFAAALSYAVWQRNPALLG